MKRRHILTAAILVAAVLKPENSHAAGFTLSSNSSSPQTISGTSTNTGTVNAGVILNIASGSGVPVTMSGGTAGSPSTLINNGTIEVTGTGSGRAVASSGTNAVLVIQNNVGATIFTINNDTVAAGTGSTTVSSVALTNAGTIESAAGGQAVNFNKITASPNSITNSGLIKATGSDAIRPGVNGTVSNTGTIQSIQVSGSSSDAVDLQTNTGVTITNASNWSAGSPLTPGTGLIDSGRHGITGGPATNIAFTASITNNLGGTIRGNNGSGINFDGFSALQTATIINGGTITGNGVTGDGDGVDVDGIMNLTNTGIIRSINAVGSSTPGQSEGISVGGGTIINSGTIEGLVASGNTNAVGRGISLLGNDITTGPLAGTREAIYANATVTNQAGGLIRGDSDSGIAVDGPASGFTVTINNNAGATIRGGATLAGLAGTNAAIRTGADNDMINNAGTIDGSSNGKAIDMGAGNNTLTITGGTASITGSINGGTGGTNTMTVNLGAGNTFGYSGAITNFTNTGVQSGRFNLSGSTTSTNVSVTGGTFNYTGSGALGSNITVNGGELKSNGGNLTGALTLTSGTVSGTNFTGQALTIGAGLTLFPGNSPGTLSSGSETWAGGGSYLWEINRLAADGGTQGSDPGWDFADITGTLNITASAGNKFHLNLDSLGLLTSWNNSQTYAFNLATASGGILGFDPSDFLIDASAFDDLHDLGGGFFHVAQNGNSLELDFTPVPEPATVGFGFALLSVAFLRRRRAQGRGMRLS